MTNAASPATGRSASGACAKDSTSLMPAACSVAAVDPRRRRRARFSGGRSNGGFASRETVRVSFVQHVSGNSTRSDEFRYFFIAGFLNGF